jgi:hypothetical protein
VPDAILRPYTRNAVHYQPTQNRAIVLADGVQIEPLSTSVQGFQRSYRKLEHPYTTAYNRLQLPKETRNDVERTAD